MVQPPIASHTAVVRAGPLALVAVAALLYGFNIGSFPITDGDAALYGRVARNVVESGDLLRLRFERRTARCSERGRRREPISASFPRILSAHRV